MTNKFTEHPATVGETYGQHFVSAMGFSLSLLRAAFYCAVHAVLPWMFVTTGSPAASPIFTIGWWRTAAASTAAAGRPAADAAHLSGPRPPLCCLGSRADLRPRPASVSGRDAPRRKAMQYSAELLRLLPEKPRMRSVCETPVLVALTAVSPGPPPEPRRDARCQSARPERDRSLARPVVAERYHDGDSPPRLGAHDDHARLDARRRPVSSCGFSSRPRTGATAP